jgi:hypothetical protein
MANRLGAAVVRSRGLGHQNWAERSPKRVLPDRSPNLRLALVAATIAGALAAGVFLSRVIG